MRTQIVIIAAMALSSLALATTVGAAGGGTVSAPPSAPSAAPRTPEEVGRDAYNLGLKKRDKAWKLEEKAAAASASQAQRDKHLSKARKLYEKAIPLFLNATDKVPTFHQAFSSLGYAYRKTGDFDAALKAYDRALALAPRYGEAIEYRGVAYLGRDRLDDAKQAYMHLFSLDRALADQLLEEMQAWLEERRADPAGVSVAEIDGFAAWIEEHGELAAQTARLFQAAERSWGD